MTTNHDEHIEVHIKVLPNCMINTNVLETQHLLHKIKGLATAYGTVIYV